MQIFFSHSAGCLFIANKEAIIIDNYAGKELLDILKVINVKIIIVSKNIDEFAALLESKMAESLEFKVSVDKTSSNEYDYLIFTTSYNSIEDYNKKVKEALSQYNQLLYFFVCLFLLFQAFDILFL